MAARSMASSTITFGLVAVPVRLYPAVRESAGLSFHLLHGKDGVRLRQQLICPKDDDVVPHYEAMKGYEYAKDEYVTFTEKELVGQLTSDRFEPERYEDEVRKRIRALIDEKVETGQLTAAPEARPQAKVVDLMEAQSTYEVFGTKGTLRMSPAYSHSDKLTLQISRNGEKKTLNFPARDQFAPEVLHFSEAILRNRKPVPSGEEGLRDVRVLAAIDRSARRGRPVKLVRLGPVRRPHLEHEISRPAGKKPHLVKADDPPPERG